LFESLTPLANTFQRGASSDVSRHSKSPPSSDSPEPIETFLEVINSSKVSRNRGRGVTAKYRLLEDADIVQTVLERDERLETLASLS